MTAPVSLLIEPEGLTIQAGSTADCSVTVCNELDRVGQFELAVQAPDPTWAHLETDDLGVFPHDRASTILSFTIPDDVIPAIYPIRVHAMTLTGDLVIGEAVQHLRVQGRQEPEGVPAGGLPARIAITPETVELQPGGKAVAHVELTNESEEVAQYELSIAPPLNEWGRLVPDQVGLFPHDQASAEIQLEPPSDVLPAVYSLLLSISTQTGTPGQAHAKLDLSVGRPQPKPEPKPEQGHKPEEEQVPEVAWLHVTSPDAQLTVTLDSERSGLFGGYPHTLQLTNKSGETLHIEFETRGLPREWHLLTPEKFELEPGQTGTAQLRLTPPGEAPFGCYPFAILCKSREEERSSVRLDLTLEIPEPGDFSIKITPPLVENPANAEFRVHIMQGGASPIPVQIAGKDDEGACNYVFPPGPVVVPPFGSVTRHLYVAPHQRLIGAPARLHTFAITANTTRPPRMRRQAQARFVQTAIPAPELTLASLKAAKPGEVLMRLDIRNKSTLPGLFHLSADDSDGAGRYVFDPPAVEIPAGGTAQSTLTITPQRFGKHAGDRLVTYTVNADPEGNLLTPGQVVGQFTQKQQERPVLTLTPSHLNASGAGHFIVHLTNPRRTAIDADVHPVEQGATLAFLPPAMRVHVEPRSQSAVRLTVQPHTALVPGELRRTRTFHIEARLADLADPLRIEGTLVQVPLDYRRILTVAGLGALGLLLLLLFVILYFWMETM